jgi:hypothetical protein
MPVWSVDAMRILPIVLRCALLSVILGFAPPAGSPVDRLGAATARLRYSKAVTSDAKRLKDILAETYSTAAPDPLFTGDAAGEATALLLYAIMYHESGLRPHIERCDCSKGDGDCDQGLAAGLPQIHPEWFQGHSKDEVCADRRLQMKLALDLLQRVKKACGGNPERLAGGYHHGTSCEIAGYAQNVNDVFVKLLGAAKIRVWRDRTGWAAASIE